MHPPTTPLTGLGAAVLPISGPSTARSGWPLPQPVLAMQSSRSVPSLPTFSMALEESAVSPRSVQVPVAAASPQAEREVPSWKSSVRNLHTEVSTVSCIVSALATRLDGLLQESGGVKALRASPELVASMDANLSTQQETVRCMIGALTAATRARPSVQPTSLTEQFADEQVALAEATLINEAWQSTQAEMPECQGSPGEIDKAVVEQCLAYLDGTSSHLPDDVSATDKVLASEQSKSEPRQPRSSRSTNSRGSPRRGSPNSGRLRAPGQRMGSLEVPPAGSVEMACAQARPRWQPAAWVPPGKSSKKVERMKSSYF